MHVPNMPGRRQRHKGVVELGPPSRCDDRWLCRRGPRTIGRHLSASRRRLGGGSRVGEPASDVSADCDLGLRVAHCSRPGRTPQRPGRRDESVEFPAHSVPEALDRHGRGGPSLGGTL